MPPTPGHPIIGGYNKEGSWHFIQKHEVRWVGVNKWKWVWFVHDRYNMGVLERWREFNKQNGKLINSKLLQSVTAYF